MKEPIITLTEATCGEACWCAREPVCRCSCGGKNHGVLLTPGGVQPVRNAKLNGFRYELMAVGTGKDMDLQIVELLEPLPPRRVDKVPCRELVDGKWVDSFQVYTYHWDWQSVGSPYRLKAATRDQARVWKELSMFADMSESEWYFASPTLLWKRIDPS